MKLSSGHPERTVFCRAKGDFMRDAGILDKDMLVVERNTHTRDGDIVVAVVDNELSVKRLFLGVVKGVFRRFDR